MARRNEFLPVFTLALTVVGLSEKFAGRSFWSSRSEDHQCLCDGDISAYPSSQCLVDPWILGHVQHGLFMYLVFTTLLKEKKENKKPSSHIPTSFLCTLLAECAFEIFENQKRVIEGFRDVAYFGDSIVNSWMDIVGCLLGWCIARNLPTRSHVFALMLGVEIFSYVAFGDNQITLFVCYVHMAVFKVCDALFLS